jgi:hypothetical protein
MTRTKMDLIPSLPAIALDDGWFIRVYSRFARSPWLPREIKSNDQGTCTAFAQIVQSPVQDEDTESLRSAGQPLQVS